jgi:glycosyltransferase involved in cell wall biosynthesis
MNFVYKNQERNVRYDANLRTSLSMASGRYCFLLGNDDALATPTVLEELYDIIQKNKSIGVVITNYEGFSSGSQFRRIRQTGVLGSGPSTAAKNFRKFSFVSGILLLTSEARRHATSRWDGSEMYQMFIGCRIIAEGFPLLGVEKVMIQEGIKIQNEEVDSYRSRPKIDPCPIQERIIPLNVFGRVAVDAVEPFVLGPERERLVRDILGQFVFFTYPYWILEYRRIQSWNYAIGICLGMRPKNIFKGISLSFISRIMLYAKYALVTFLGLLVPLVIFDRFKTALYRIAKESS